MTTWIDTKNGFHRKVRVFSFAVVMCEVGGTAVKAIRLDNQLSMDQARKTAETDNPGWQFKGLFTLSDKDFERGKK